MDAVTLYSTWPDQQRAEAAARTLIEQRLAACANIIPGAISVYRWEGAMQRDSETIMIVKTSAERAVAARDALLAAHPYDVPCVTVLRIDADASNPQFLAWIGESVR